MGKVIPNRKVSCVMCCWDAQSTVEMALESIKDVCDEIVVIDHGCEDNTMDIIHECEKKWSLPIRYFSQPRTKRLWEVRLFGAYQARFDYLFYTDADQVCHTFGSYDIKKWIRNHASPGITWAIPLVTLRYDLRHAARNNVIAPPHRLFYWNARDWITQPSVLPTGYYQDLPTSRTNEVRVSRETYIFNVTQQDPLRALRRKYWTEWGRRPGFDINRIPLDNYIRQKTGVTNLEEYARQWFEQKKREALVYDENKYIPYPDVIRKRLNSLK